MRIVLDARPRRGAIRVDRAWAFFCGPTRSLRGARGLWGFSNWLWDELGERAGRLNLDARKDLEVRLPPLKDDALDLVIRLLSFWCDDVRLRRGRSLSPNRWRQPIVNLFDDQARTGAERSLFGDFSDQGSKELNLMPILGPGRSFFSLQVIRKGDSSARMHSHTAVDEYYLILRGRGTLRFNGKAIEVGPGDLIAKPTGPDAATHLNADRGEEVRILDMEVWHDRYKGTHATTKDLIYWPDYDEALMRGPGWGAGLPTRVLFPSQEIEEHWSEEYRRTPDGRRVGRRRNQRRD